jgi:hypothetical protein
MLNGQGRKVVKERLGDQINSYDHYRNLREEEAPNFDQQWSEMSRRLGFGTSTANNRLGYGHEDAHRNQPTRYTNSGHNAV